MTLTTLELDLGVNMGVSSWLFSKGAVPNSLKLSKSLKSSSAVKSCPNPSNLLDEKYPLFLGVLGVTGVVAMSASEGGVEGPAEGVPEGVADELWEELACEWLAEPRRPRESRREFEVEVGVPPCLVEWAWPWAWFLPEWCAEEPL